jgi:hypothetical protein
MIITFLMGAGIPEVTVLGLVPAFFLSKWLLKRRLKFTGPKLILWSIIASVVLAPVLLAILLALITVGFMTYEKFNT